MYAPIILLAMVATACLLFSAMFVIGRALRQRFDGPAGGSGGTTARPRQPSNHNMAADPRDLEIQSLKRRIETLEAIVTAPDKQWDDKFDER